MPAHKCAYRDATQVKIDVATKHTARFERHLRVRSSRTRSPSLRVWHHIHTVDSISSLDTSNSKAVHALLILNCRIISSVSLHLRPDRCVKNAPSNLDEAILGRIGRYEHLVICRPMGDRHVESDSLWLTRTIFQEQKQLGC